MNKVLVSDYDGTFYLNDEDIKENINLINKCKDRIIFIIATGRSYKDYLNKQIKYNIPSNYLIINHGASILKNNRVIYNVFIEDIIKEDLIKDLEVKNSILYFACSLKETYSILNIKKLTKIHIKYANSDMARKIYNKIIVKYKNYINCFIISKGTALEIISNKANKKEAILEIIKREKINIDNVYTVGDNYTDYEMLKTFKGFAMENSVNKIKELNIPTIKSVKEIINLLIKN